MKRKWGKVKGEKQGSKEAIEKQKGDLVKGVYIYIERERERERERLIESDMLTGYQETMKNRVR